VHDEIEELKQSVLLAIKIAKKANSGGGEPLLPLLVGAYMQRRAGKTDFSRLHAGKGEYPIVSFRDSSSYDQEPS